MSNVKGQKPARRIELKAAIGDVGVSTAEGSKSVDIASTSTKNNTKNDKSGGRANAKQPAVNIAKKRNAGLKIPAARAVKSGDDSAAKLLLGIERESRQVDSEAELRFLIVNATRRVINYRQAFLLIKKGSKKYITVAISSLSAVDRNSNFVRWIEESIGRSVKENGDKDVALINVSSQDGDHDPDGEAYPFGAFVLIPLKLRDETVFAQLVLAREASWEEVDVTPASRLVETYAHSWEALSGPVVLKKRHRDKTLTAILFGVAIAAVGFLPVPLTVLAPAEVSASNPVVITAPLDAVLEKIEVEPNTIVKKGDVLFRINDTDLRNRVDVSGQNVQVAEARYLQAQRNSFADPSAKRDLAIALSELKLKAAEYDYARDLLARSVVKAPLDGLIIFSDKNDWTGKPVSTGERIMRIADPSKVELTISLPVADAIVLEKQSRVRLFMDSSPLHPVEAKLTSASYHAKPDINDVLSYRVVAKFDSSGESAVPRIGLRGTAQIHGEKVPLAFFIFRKPLSVIRQWIGF